MPLAQPEQVDHHEHTSVVKGVYSAHAGIRHPRYQTNQISDLQPNQRVIRSSFVGG